ncbi:hypothetical protein [Sphingobium lactosutens]|uniref:hypothetical protein n=1 Tax=Sphingobium lactosutens TaxID=522773 RepID=UPI0021186EA7|nr:hypothetical protein [Sphingobium lactosutens]
MRLAYLLPLSFLVAAPVAAQVAAVRQGNFGNPSKFSSWNSAPVGGWGADAGNFGVARLDSNKLGQAQRLVAEGRYAEADPLLNELIGRTSSRHVRFLKGLAALGLGDPATARRFFERALPGGGRVGSAGVMSGLALAEIRLGNAGAARAILNNLRYQQAKCRSDCDRAGALKQAVSMVERELT